MSGFGGMVTFIPDGGQDEANRIVAATRIFRLAESLGGVESLIEVPAMMTHLSVQGTELEVPADMIRLSVGLEHIDDLVEDLDRALGVAEDEPIDQHAARPPQEYGGLASGP